MQSYVYMNVTTIVSLISNNHFLQENNAEMVFLGSLTNKDLLQTWTQDKCVPLVS